MHSMDIFQYVKQHHPERIARGKFTTAYLYATRVLLHSNDPLKECNALGWFPASSRLPRVEHSDLCAAREGYSVYTMPRYRTSRSVQSLLTAREYASVYLPLRDLALRATYGRNAYNWQQDFAAAVSKAPLSPANRALLCATYEACMQYSHRIRFECSPRNVAATAAGRLILLDCFYIHDW